MLFKAILVAIASSFLSLLSYLFINFLRKGDRWNGPLICELIRQARLLLFIWVFYFFIYFALFSISVEKINFLLNRLNIRPIPETFGFIYGIVFYLFLAFIYLTVYYLIDRSVSATILEIIDKAPGGRLTLVEIKKIYDIEKKYINEINGMLEGGFIIKEQYYYRNSFKGSLYAKMAGLIKRLLKLESAG